MTYWTTNTRIRMTFIAAFAYRVMTYWTTLAWICITYGTTFART